VDGLKVTSKQALWGVYHLGRVAMEWFWEGHMREASAISFAVLPEKYCQKE
jgi:hypothetical protein